MFYEYKSEHGTVIIEVDAANVGAPENVPFRAGTTEVVQTVVKTARLTFDMAMGTIPAIANGFLVQAKKFEVQPGEIELSFGLDAAGEVGFFSVAKGSSKAAFNVKIKWSGKDFPVTGPGTAG